ncbi:hypothetical protein HTZ77_09580 [Nonomuraea sp. SMC257]|uniref:Lipoprotein n=1 Tax=Nonomuraea montanisoli TaxID=2741721 RepID=A0A7Y6I4Q1_9ACTN|nr:hypothetical protein [Nonomuraea montanisoli]NUW31677.1 hypothetical protein [Nonomuraea montanisoli]
MRSPFAVAALGLALALTAGCGVDTASPARAAARFHTAVAAHQEAAACALLTPTTAEKLPDPDETCAQALAALKLGPGGRVTGVEVWGDDAVVRMAGDTVFLHRFSGGWRVTAAGCEPRRDLPYDCEVED